MISAHKEDLLTFLEMVGQFYLQGTPIDWDNFYKPNRKNKIVLPDYPFKGQRYWIKNKDSPQNLLKANKHPFLLQEIETPLLEGANIFLTQVSAKWPDFIEDHLLYNVPVVPGATYISTILSAAKLLSNQESCKIENIEFINPLIVNTDLPRQVQTLIHPIENGMRHFEIVCQAVGDSKEWIKLVQGTLNERNEMTVFSDENRVEKIKSRCPEECTKEHLIQFFTEIGLTLGPKLRWIEHLYMGENEVLAKLRAPQEKEEEEGYILHPGLIDSCIQTIFGKRLKMRGQPDLLSIPFHIKEFLYHAGKGRLAWVHLIHKPTKQENTYRADLTFFNDQGQQIGQMVDFFERTLTQNMLISTMKDQKEESRWFYAIEWKEKALTQSKKPTLSGAWLIFKDSYGFADPLEEKIQFQGGIPIQIEYGTSFNKISEHHYQINPEIKSDFEKLLRDINHSIKGLVYLKTLEDRNKHLDVGNMKQSQIYGVKSVLYLLQALIEAKLENPVSLYFVTNGTQEFKNQTILPFQSPLWGFMRTAILEYPEIQCKLIDLETHLDPLTQNPLLMEEILQEDTEEQIAYRQEKRFVPRLKAFREQKSKEIQIDPLGSYLITGGLGGLGLKVADWLIKQGAKHLVLAARREPSKQTIRLIEELQSKGAKIEIISLDVTNEQDLSSLMQKFGNGWPELKGVIHAAGVIDDASLLSLVWSQFENVFAPKIQGILSLHMASLKKSLDFFVLFSSIASIWGSTGQSNYAAANAFLDCFASYRRVQGLPILSINWGPWAEFGMAAELGALHQIKGWHPMSPERAIKALELALQQNLPNLLIADINWKFISSKNSFLSELIETTVVEAPLLLQHLKNQPRSERNRILIDYLQKIVGKILGFSFIDPEMSLFELGLDSLRAIELRNKLQIELGKEHVIPATLAFEYPTINKLCDLIIKLIFKEEERKVIEKEAVMSKEDIEKLLS